LAQVQTRTCGLLERTAVGVCPDHHLCGFTLTMAQGMACAYLGCACGPKTQWHFGDTNPGWNRATPAQLACGPCDPSQVATSRAKLQELELRMLTDLGLSLKPGQRTAPVQRDIFGACSTRVPSADDGSENNSNGCSSPAVSEGIDGAYDAQEASFSHTPPKKLNIPPPPGLTDTCQDDRLPGNPGFIMSRGSKNHHLEKCRPCQKYYTPEGCARGSLCNFCHFQHDEGKMTEIAVYSAKAKLRRFLHKGGPQSQTSPQAGEAWDIRVGRKEAMASEKNEVRARPVAHVPAVQMQPGADRRLRGEAGYARVGPRHTENASMQNEPMYVNIPSSSGHRHGGVVFSF